MILQVTFPVGDWFLGVGDGGIGRDQEPLERGRVTSFFGKSSSPSGQSCRRCFDHERWVELGKDFS